MLPQFYQDHLKSQLQPAPFLLLTLVVKLLQSTKQAKLESLAANLPTPILFESRRRKLQRFLGIRALSIETLWFPIVSWWLQRTFGLGQTLYLVVDRTRWMEVNQLVLSVVWGHRAWPVYWCPLDKKGNSNFAEQTQTLSRVLPLFKGYDTVVLGDREFCSVRLARWLKLQGQSIKQKGLQKYIGRVKEPGRVAPRHSHFYIGLYGQAWVQFMADCSEIVDQLLLLSPHKRPYYKKGRRAMELIGSVF